MSHWKILALCAFSTFLDGYDIQALGLAIPGMAEHFGVAPTEFTPAMSGTLAGMAAGAIFLAPLGDRFPRHIMMAFVLFLIGVTTTGLLFSTSPAQLAIWRIASGLGMGALVPLAIAIAAEAAPESRRTLVVTFIVLCTALGSFASGIISPFLDDNFGWQGIFGVGAIMPILASALFFLLRNKNIQPQEISDRKPAKNMVGAVLELFAAPYTGRTILLWITFFISFFATYSLISWLPSLLVDAGWARGEAQRAAGIMAMGSILGGLGLAWAADKGRGIEALCIAFTLGAAAFAGIATEPTSKPIWQLLIFTVGAGAIGSQLALGSLASTFYPAEIRATGLGWSSGMGRTGSIFGPIILAAMVSANFTPSDVIGSLAIPIALCAICVFLLPYTLRNDARS